MPKYSFARYPTQLHFPTNLPFYCLTGFFKNSHVLHFHALPGVGHEVRPFLHAPANLPGNGPVGGHHQPAGEQEEDKEVVELVETPAQGVGVIPDAPKGFLDQTDL